MPRELLGKHEPLLRRLCIAADEGIGIPQNTTVSLIVSQAAPQLSNGLEAGEQQQDLEALSFHLVSGTHKDFQVHVRRDAEFEPEGVARVDIHHLAGRRISVPAAGTAALVALVRWELMRRSCIKSKGLTTGSLARFAACSSAVLRGRASSSDPPPESASLSLSLIAVVVQLD